MKKGEEYERETKEKYAHESNRKRSTLISIFCSEERIDARRHNVGRRLRMSAAIPATDEGVPAPIEAVENMSVWLWRSRQPVKSDTNIAP